MEDSQKTDQIIRFFMNDLSPEDQDRLKGELERSPELKSEFELYGKIFSELRNSKVHPAPDAYVQNFEKWLETEISSSRKTTKIRKFPNWKIGIAASVILLMGIFSLQWFIGSQPAVRTLSPEKDLLQLVSAENTTSRIKGINRYQGESVDPAIRDVFIRVLEKDKSTNVRLAALDALSNLPNDDRVKAALIRILENDQEPAVQMAIINVLVKWKDPATKGTLQELLEKDQIPDDVKEEAFLGVTRL